VIVNAVVDGQQALQNAHRLRGAPASLAAANVITDLQVEGRLACLEASARNSSPICSQHHGSIAELSSERAKEKPRQMWAEIEKRTRQAGIVGRSART